MAGLTDEEVIISRKKYGSNSVNLKNENKFIKLFIDALGDPIIKIMLIALVVRFVLMFSDADWYETLGMLISILLSSLISSLSEYGSNKAFSRLQGEYENIYVRVRRNGVMISIKSDDIVVGDLVFLESGELVPADGVVVSGSVGVDEASINGEAKEVRKGINSKLFKGSVILSDKCTMKVKNVGVNTIYGNIAKELTEKVPDSPMKLRLRRLAKIVSRIGYIGAILASCSYIFNVLFISNNFDMDIILGILSNPREVIDILIHTVTLAVTIIIVCVPEGLPMMLALVLSSNMKRMLKSNVLVRKPVGIETSGSIKVLLTDKTGTLTKGKLSVIGIIDADDNHYNSLSEIDKNVRDRMVESLLYNNDSYYEGNNITSGNATDKAILAFVGKREKTLNIESKTNFNSSIKYSSVKLSNGCEYFKGASEVLLSKCRFYLDKNGDKKYLTDKKKINNLIQSYTKRGMRVICDVYNNTLLGFILIRDDIRSEAGPAIDEIKKASIDVIMITGDDVNTATSIATELNMIDEDSLILTHDDLEKLDDDFIVRNYHRIKVIARALPKDKSRISSLLERHDIVVGMTGDGVNDAPALKKANVGFAMGSGTEVAKYAADIVILDDNISSIASAILYGRTIFKSVRKFIIFQLTMNICALFLSLVGPFIGVTTPVTVMQMLWINMIMDTFAGLAYSYEAPLKRYMNEYPISKHENILNKYMYKTIIFIGLYSTILLVLFLKLDVFKLFIRSDTKYYMTAFFSLFIFLSVFNAFNARTTRINILSGILKNKVFLVIICGIFLAQIYLIYFGGSLFRTYGLLPKEFIFILLLGFSVIPIDMMKKMFLKHNR